MSIPPPDLPEDTAYHLQRCEGYLDLKMTTPARAEWEKAPADLHTHPTVEALLMRLLVEEKNWVAARDLARTWRERNPEDAGAWIQLAYAIRCAEGLTAAEQVLLTAREKFPKEPIIPYNLACYACQSGRLPETRQRLNEAAGLDPMVLRLAAEDDDLQPLWMELPGP